MAANETERASWREQVEHAIADHRAHGKTPKAEPATEAEWRALEERYPGSPLRAAWFAITGRATTTKEV